MRALNADLICCLSAQRKRCTEVMDGWMGRTTGRSGGRTDGTDTELKVGCLVQTEMLVAWLTVEAE